MTQILLSHPEVARFVGSKRVVAASPSKYGDLFVVTTNGVTYDYLRCFNIGNDVVVSVDASNASNEKMIEKLLEDAAKA